MINMSLQDAANAVNGSITGENIMFRGCSIDTRTLEAGNLFIALRGERLDGHAFIPSAAEKGACAAMIENESVAHDSLPLIIINDSVKAMGMLAGYWRREFDIPLLAITGSNGKTTVKEMVTSILGLRAAVLSTRGNLNNHIGVPLTLFRLASEHKYAVIEMGANHAGEIALLSSIARPSVAVITQCAPAHLEGFGSEDGVASAKAEIYDGLCEDGIAIINADDKYAEFWKQKASGHRQITFGIENTADIMASDISHDTVTARTSFSIQFPGTTCPLSIPLSGIHSVLNSIAAAACCTAIGIPESDIKAGLENMPVVEGRMQMIGLSRGNRIFNDTYNANPGSLKAGLEVLSRYDGDRCLILGDMRELGESSAAYHKRAGELARESGVQRLYTLGELSRNAREAFGNGAKHFIDINDLVAAVKKDLTSNTTILVKGSRAMSLERVVRALGEES